VSTEQNKAIASTFFERFSAGDIQGALNTMTDDATWWTGKEGTLALTSTRSMPTTCGRRRLLRKRAGPHDDHASSPLRAGFQPSLMSNVRRQNRSLIFRMQGQPMAANVPAYTLAPTNVGSGSRPADKASARSSIARAFMEGKKMRSHPMLAVTLSTAILAASGCAGGPVAAPPELPASLRPPADQSLFLEALASGVQIYECAPKAGQPSAFEWTFRAPEATLADRSGRSIGKHYAGPTWESVDGSTVVGEVKAGDAGPTPSAIPWLLLASKSTTGAGVFTPTKSIQRVQTVGGIAPSEPCTSANAKQVARVPYTATYYFYRGAS
jgi:hypothetical protein